MNKVLAYVYYVIFDILCKQKIINHIKWEQWNKQILKIELIVFTTIWLILKISSQNLLNIDKKSYKDIGIYHIGYISTKKIDDS